MARINYRYRHNSIVDIEYIVVDIRSENGQDVIVFEEVKNRGHIVRIKASQLSDNYTKIG